ncbi:LexA family transcriptional regulator [Crenobacter sp. SG2303]|uniref:LexA family transcriptional regulator n=1 Tax=Crenobacter oryzisoli TaxID=3056844 RepID=A0ABT7XU16_9NEIS|nr:MULTISPECIES: LexA family transcriptional regulator [unclassified Crenobacter]MDN0077279.1 LexA family transcriptional regulator [Crenobacter sp. SG2303]MDN0082157.1 LexA family transcriptional regulator [Crenobacter sp. SG2305]
MSKDGRGGRREGAGRPTGTGRFGDEPLVKMALPARLRQEVIDFAVARLAKHHETSPLVDRLPTPEHVLRAPLQPSHRAVPLYLQGVRAGFPTPAADEVDQELDLNQYLLEGDGETTFMVRVEGDSMIEAGLFDDDLLVVNRRQRPQHGDIVVALLDGTEFTCKRLYSKDGRIALLPENPAYPPIEIRGEREMKIWGVVTGMVRKLGRK